MLCLARAYRDEPLRRVVAGAGPRIIYVVNPDAPDAARDSATAGVGFPVDAVFHFDADLYSRLRAAYDARDESALWTLWQAARPLSLELVEA